MDDLSEKAVLITGGAQGIGEAARQKYGTPEGIARIIAFMISDEADYLRGAIFTR
jgi:NAD(P)-dependent dehydrogenase (short-subunit alcohol dehydrogenase family)